MRGESQPRQGTGREASTGESRRPGARWPPPGCDWTQLCLLFPRPLLPPTWGERKSKLRSSHLTPHGPARLKSTEAPAAHHAAPIRTPLGALALGRFPQEIPFASPPPAPPVTMFFLSQCILDHRHTVHLVSLSPAAGKWTLGHSVRFAYLVLRHPEQYLILSRCSVNSVE